MQSKYQRTEGANSNTLLSPPPTLGASFNDEGDWEISKKRSRRKQRKKENKSIVRTRAKPDAILIRSKVQNVTYLSVFKLMKDRVVKQHVAENVNKIRQIKTGKVLVQLQRGSNAKDIKDAVAAAVGMEATVLPISQQVALDMRDKDLDTTEGEVQKALAELAGVPVDALTVKVMRPAAGGTQMAIITIPSANALDIIRSGKVMIGCVIARVREKVRVPMCLRCLAFGLLSHNCDSGNNTTKLCFLCGATGRLAANCKDEPKCTQCEAIEADHRHRSGSANCTALVKAKERRLRKGNS